ncbi:G-type lectin S-receptor-like serine/threonine-protein kinase [Morus notabilis]|uniref:G-type lectin S-receptor-like serine/threonine-protein kinase n=1 Tax=Morus notabilis TaxID=981085 RepID=W9QYJ9_9ROSA|nr:G-type lectin S-receptor-like serine/threonine-protein kinase [Morus notabilis]
MQEHEIERNGESEYAFHELVPKTPFEGSTRSRAVRHLVETCKEAKELAGHVLPLTSCRSSSKVESSTSLVCGGQKNMDDRASTISQLVNRLLSYIFLIITLSYCSCQLFCSARDIIEHDTPIRDNGETLVSAGGKFELGFFTPNGSSNGTRYVGIWHKFSPDTVVWVANRDYPLFSSTGVFGVHKDGNLHVLDNSTGNSCWSTGLDSSRSPNRTVKLMDSGNLELKEGSQLGKSLWESFKNPTNTFLPHMKMDADLKLTSWKEENDPGIGNFIFKQESEGENEFITTKKSIPYWKSGGKFATSDKMPAAVVGILLNSTSKSTSRFRTLMIVLKFDGNITFQYWDTDRKAWVPIWSEPRDRCNTYYACGDFGSCSINNNGLTCKCLTGFKPSIPEKWNSSDFSGGCTRGTKLCGENDKFLSFKMRNMGNPESSGSLPNNETDCRHECVGNCQCQAYLFQAAKSSKQRGSSSSSTGSCSIWLRQLHDLQEEYADGGYNLSVRVALSDLESTVRNCNPCGTSIVPYPLSTGPDCGDPIHYTMYFSFQCSTSTGSVTFKSPSGEYRVISTDPGNRKFVIQVEDFDNCEARNSRGKNLQLNKSLPFSVSNSCYAKDSHKDRGEIEIVWEIPSEPTCTSQASCKEWPDSTCSIGRGGNKRCLCNKNFDWDGVKLNCTANQEGTFFHPSEGKSRRKTTPLSLIVVPIVVSVAVLACSFVSFIIWRKKMSKKNESIRSDQRSKDLLKLDTQRRIKHLINSGEFDQEDEEGIDVPFFDFESIIAATDDFSDANKLGQGGYGPVYKGKFPGGQEIAVKRLSSVSGQGLQEFKNEVVLIAKLQHRNLVRLRGYCIKGEEKILLYEYMPNKSLDSFIFDDTKSVLLDWEMRFNIILGIARGLLYLHQDSRLRIIHRDLKTSNILLDQDMEPKVSDFGLARIVGGKQTEASTNRVVGTYGYMSPEYALEGLFSVKSDVFSFGVVLLEIISGKRNTRLVQYYEQPLSLLGYAFLLQV